MVAVDRAAEVGVLRSLVANGADLDQEDNDGYTALDLSNRKCSEAGTMSSEKRNCHSEIKAFLLKCSPPCLEFGICGLDITLEKKLLCRVLTPPRGSRVVPVAAFQLAYQGFPWQPQDGYTLGSSLDKRRYTNGATYPAWHEIDDMIAAMPAGTWLSFHLSESDKCPYVSSLLKGDPSALSKYKARHVQINIRTSRAISRHELSHSYQTDTADSWPFFQDCKLGTIHPPRESACKEHRPVLRQVWWDREDTGCRAGHP